MPSFDSNGFPMRWPGGALREHDRGASADDEQHESPESSQAPWRHSPAPAASSHLETTMNLERRPRNTSRFYAEAVVTVDEVRAVAGTLPRSSEGLVRGQVKFRIDGRIVWLALSRDRSIMGFAFPKELRQAPPSA